MKSNPLVSIVVPVYNGEQYLNDTLQSILAQTISDFEVIVVNDGSTDKTEQLVLNLTTHDDRVLYYLKSNSGVSDSRNFGLKKATGEFVVFFDADDIMMNDFLSSRIEFLKANTAIGLCGSKINIIDGNGEISDSSLSAPGQNMLEEILFYKPGIATVPSNFMFRHKLLIDNNINFDERLSSTADRMFLCKLALITKACCIPDKNFCYRVHIDSMYNDPGKRKNVFNDNERFIKILISENIVPDRIGNAFKKKNYYMLAGAGWKSHFFMKTLLYGFKYYLLKLKW